MNRNFIKIGAFAVAVLVGQVFTGCKNDAKTADAPATEQTATPDGTNTAAPQTTPAGEQASNDPTTQEPAPPAGPTTSISFEETSYNYGKIKAGTVVEHSYKFKNTGTEPLVISDAKGSCGCTVPVWPREPIAPGASSEIKVSFDSKGKSGAQSKRVTLTANTNPSQTFLTIDGEVMADENAAPAVGAPAKK